MLSVLTGRWDLRDWKMEFLAYIKINSRRAHVYRITLYDIHLTDANHEILDWSRLHLDFRSKVPAPPLINSKHTSKSMAPNISIRKYIQWFPDVAKEPTGTVVLTTGENRFVDIRILKPTNSKQEEETGGGGRKQKSLLVCMLTAIGILHLSRLDWAFAGISSSEFVRDGEGNAILHSKWHHWIDSRTEHAETVTDEGDMFPQPDSTTIERGSMTNPSNGKMADYEECWEDLEPLCTDIDTEGGQARKVCVLQIHDDDNEARGMVIRLGQFCQGVLRVGEYFSLEQWQWRKSEGWRRNVRMGDLWLPCGPMLEGERLRLGGELNYGEYSWKVVEISKF